MLVVNLYPRLCQKMLIIRGLSYNDVDLYTGLNNSILFSFLVGYKIKKLNRAFIYRISTKSALRASHRIPDRMLQLLYFSQFPGEHCRGAIITNDAPL